MRLRLLRTGGVDALRIKIFLHFCGVGGGGGRVRSPGRAYLRVIPEGRTPSAWDGGDNALRWSPLPMRDALRTYEGPDCWCSFSTSITLAQTLMQYREKIVHSVLRAATLPYPPSLQKDFPTHPSATGFSHSTLQDRFSYRRLIVAIMPLRN